MKVKITDLERHTLRLWESLRELNDKPLEHAEAEFHKITLQIQELLADAQHIEYMIYEQPKVEKAMRELK